MKYKDRKIIILQDYFLYKGGGERLAITLAKAIGADIATSFVAKDSFDPRKFGVKTIELLSEGSFSKMPGIRHIKVQFAFLFKTLFLKKYDIVIYSGDCVSAIYNASGKKNIAYIHTPPRHLYDNYEMRLRQYGFLKREIFRIFAIYNRLRFKDAVKRMDLLVANSKNVQNRIKKYLKLNSAIVYPPCDIKKFKWISQGDYYFSWARLYDVKRVDKIVEAFTKMPDKKLIVGSGGPELDKIKKIAEGYENIKILDWISDKELLRLIGNCIATIYIPIREDFGMSPVESMSAGKPVIGVKEGGLKETIIDGKTGILMKSNFLIDDLVGSVKKLNKEKAYSMRVDCENRAKEFSEKIFIDSMRGIVRGI